MNDLAFALSTDGPIKAILLVAVDGTGRSSGRYQADTLIGDQEVPKEVAIRWGANTAGLGVAERGALVNTPDGAIPDYPIAYDAGKALHAAAKAKGEYGFGAQWAGQGAPLARAMPAADLVERLADELR